MFKNIRGKKKDQNDCSQIYEIHYVYQTHTIINTKIISAPFLISLWQHLFNLHGVQVRSQGNINNH